jgi:hypothetical protein
LQAPIYEVRPHTPKKAWNRHGIPVSIDLEDNRGVCLGEIHPDLPDEPLEFPCYAVFLDPAHALIVTPIKSEPHSCIDSTGNNVSNTILTTSEANHFIREDPRIKGWNFKAIVDAVRVGLGVFTKNAEGLAAGAEDEQEQEPRMWDPEVDGELTPDMVMHVTGDESWGPVKKEDQWVWITVV